MCPQDARVLVKVMCGVKDRNASSTVDTIPPSKTGTMESGVMQTSIPAPMLRPIKHLKDIMFQAMEVAKLLVAQVNIYKS